MEPHSLTLRASSRLIYESEDPVSAQGFRHRRLTAVVVQVSVLRYWSVCTVCICAAPPRTPHDDVDEALIPLS